MHNRDMPKPILYRPGVLAIVGELIPAAMPQHVEVNREGKLSPQHRRRERDDVVGGTESGAYQHRRGNRPKGRPGGVSSQLLA